ncbi:hypothetical protein ACXX9E_29650 [Pseudomonas sp. GNP014]
MLHSSLLRHWRIVEDVLQYVYRGRAVLVVPNCHYTTGGVSTTFHGEAITDTPKALIILVCSR